MPFPWHVENGRIAFSEKVHRKMQEWAASHEGAKGEMVERKAKRTRSQNAYIHVLFKYIADETGESVEDVKTIEKRRHLQPRESFLFGERQLVLPSTASLSNPEASEFIEKLLADCAFLGIEVPSPEELGYISNHSYPKG